MSYNAEAARRSLEVARSVEKFENKEFQKSLDRQTWDKESEGWLSGSDRISRVEKAINHKAKYRKKPKPLSPSELAVTPRAEPLAQITLENPDDITIPDILEFAKEERFQRYYHANNCWLRKLEEDTGKVGDKENLLKKEKGRAELRRLNDDIALTLEREGVKAWRRISQKIFRYYPNSGTVASAPQYRRLCFLPMVAAMKRRKYVDAMDAYLEKNPFCRMYVLTSGERVLNRPCIGPDEKEDIFEQIHSGKYRVIRRATPAKFKKRCSFIRVLPIMEKGEKLACGIGPSTTLRERIRNFNREVSRFSSALFKRWGVEIVFRATELGTPDHCPKGGRISDVEHIEGMPIGADGELTRNRDEEAEFHVHAHLLVNQHRFIQPDEFEKLLKWINKKWPYYWHEAGLLLKSREVCKYITKPAEISKLSPTELVSLFKATERLKLIQPMGEIKAAMSRRRESLLKLEPYETFSGQRKWREVPDTNRIAWAQRPKEPKEGEPASKEWIEYIRRRRLEADQAETRKPCETGDLRVLAKCPPSFAPGSCVMEPSVLVMGDAWDKETVDRHPAVLAMRAATRDAWEAGLRAVDPIRVHVDHPTVLEKSWVLEGSDFSREEFFDDPPPTTEIFDFYSECSPI